LTLDSKLKTIALWNFEPKKDFSCNLSTGNPDVLSEAKCVSRETLSFESLVLVEKCAATGPLKQIKNTLKDH